MTGHMFISYDSHWWTGCHRMPCSASRFLTVCALILLFVRPRVMAAVAKGAWNRLCRFDVRICRSCLAVVTQPSKIIYNPIQPVTSKKSSDHSSCHTKARSDVILT